MLSRTVKFFLDVLFPISCISCAKPGAWLCESCLSKIQPKSEQVCPVCEKRITPDGQVCFSCRKNTSLNGLLVAASYQNKLITALVHYYKYRFIRDLSEPLGEIMIKSFLNSRLPLPDLILPVPLHKRRLRWRGFNQGELLADYLGGNLTPGYPIPVFNNILKRSRYTYPQMKIKNYSQRQKNIQGAFSLNRKAMSKDKTVLLIDDICTTGSTLFECAKVLKKAGAREVFAIVVARQEYKKK